MKPVYGVHCFFYREITMPANLTCRAHPFVCLLLQYWQLWFFMFVRYFIEIVIQKNKDVKFVELMNSRIVHVV